MNLSFFSTSNTDAKGQLRSFEISKFKKFKIKRFFIINFKNLKTRGNHAHKKCHQYLICLEGSARIDCTNKIYKKSFKISKKDSKGILIQSKTWNTIKPLTKSCQILCLCSMKYLKNDYIHDYSIFKQNYLK